MDIAIVLLIAGIITALIVYYTGSKIEVARSYIWVLFAVHFILSAVYFIYSATSSSDSVGYFKFSAEEENWGNMFTTGTLFIRFLAWPFTYLLNLSYYATMVVFSYLGFLGIVYLYFAAKENLDLPPVWGKFTMVELVFLLPNLHFWTSSIGKGSAIIWGIGIFVYGLSRFNRRLPALIVGSLLVFMIRPHIFMALLVGSITGIFLTATGIKTPLKWIIFLVSVMLFFIVKDNVLEYAGTESLNVFDSNALLHKASELKKATSGVDIQNYNFFMKIFTFWFRPLFFDSPGVLGLVVSFENLVYLFMFYVILKEGLSNWKYWNGWFRICLFIFIFGSIVLAQVSGNLGIALRQKAQMMPLFFIIFCKVYSYRYVFKLQ